MSKLPQLFLASSKEALPTAEAIQIGLDDVAQVKAWNYAFNLSSYPLPTLIAQGEKADFAVFVFHKDDQTIVRGNTYSSVRDNVLFELGLFIGLLGLDRCFVLVPKSSSDDFRLPSDLVGITVSTYDDLAEDILDRVSTSCAKIKQAIRKFVAISSTNNAETAKHPLNQPEPIQTLETELWRTRLDLQRAVEQTAALNNAIATHFFGVAKPATELEIKRWEEGAAVNYERIPRIPIRDVFFVDQDVIVPPLCGANSITVIVASGVRIYGLDQWSHNTIYFMDGFRMHGLML